MLHKRSVKCLQTVLLVVFILSLVPSAAGSQIGDKGGDYPNLLFIVVDTLRADHLGCYGGKANTPNIDKLARDGVLFENAFSHTPITLPAHTTVFTSLYPHLTRITNNGQRVSDEFQTLAERLRIHGFNANAVVSLNSLNRWTNINQGFDHYLDDSGRFLSLKRADEVNQEMTDTMHLLKGTDNWVQFLHYSDPHEPYHSHGLRSTPVSVKLRNEPIANLDIANQSAVAFKAILNPGKNVFQIDTPRRFHIRGISIRSESKDWNWKAGPGVLETKRDFLRIDRKGKIEVYNDTTEIMPAKVSLFVSETLTEPEVRESYQKEVEYADRKIGEILKLFEEKGLLKNTLLIFTSDHGEGIGDHGIFGHVVQLYNSLIHVPLIMVYPDNLPGGKRIAAHVRHIDIMPTLFDILKISNDIRFNGESLLPVIAGTNKENRPVLSMTFKPEAGANLISLIHNEYKIIKNLDSGALELYDIKSDYNELRDLGKDDFIKLNRMERRLENIMAAEGFDHDLNMPGEESINLDKKQLEKLRGLGYVR